MSQKPNSLQSQTLKCAGMLAVALLATAGPAAADFVGVKAVNKDDPATDLLCTQGTGDEVPGPLTVCNVYANFDNPVDRLLSLGNADLQVFNGANPDVFFQHPFNAPPISPSCNQITDPPHWVFQT